ncbi:class I SAM-dependent methyltransferase [Candidatus Paracaedibacter symbiosus]|uniref:class I SAM-dependent methyltransferase n=1 Tax=Candidatus Paracaedibacter symbiosus TaxID=244582 RepID=UPI0006919D4B|nr:methyltransferase domain-containing protein [Candidatus Paracaedibacter symbiosus]
MINYDLVKRENSLFFRRWLSEPKQLGTLAPISKKLARSAAKLIHDPACLKVVEIGAGTGRLTRSLMDYGVKPENLTAVELDASFCGFLRSSMPKINVIHGDACELPNLLGDKLSGSVDVVYSVIPLMYLDPEIRDRILEQSLAVLKPGGKFYHVCYTPLSPFRKNKSIKSKRLVSSWLNIPPGFVWEFRRAESER